jgi:pSer/pThr/pTyr-binding forkhead associated (FHA) protein
MEGKLPSFQALPKDTDGKGERLKVLLVGPKTTALNRGFEIFDHVIIGRDDGETPVDIDLTPFGPGAKGVSRRHAEFKVHDGKLFVIDLGSSNGTYLKGDRIEVGIAVEVPNGSVLSFAALQVQVRIFD